MSTYRSWDSVFCITTGYGLDDRGVGVRVPVGSRIFYSSCVPDRFWGSPNLIEKGAKRPWHEVDHSPPTSVEVKKTWVYTSTPPYVFMAHFLIS
jgi:hypothetical protein